MKQIILKARITPEKTVEEKSLPKIEAPHQKLLTNLLSLSTKGKNKISQQNIKIKISLQVKN